VLRLRDVSVKHTAMVADGAIRVLTAHLYVFAIELAATADTVVIHFSLLG
jgi:hypothetical protein